MIFVDGTDENGEHWGCVIVRSSEVEREHNGKTISLIGAYENVWEWEPLQPLTIEEARRVEEYHQACMMQMIVEVELEAAKKRVEKARYWIDQTPPHIVSS